MKRSKFSLGAEKLLSFSQNELCPINLTEVLPGDSISASTNAFLRAAPLVTPVMHTVNARIEHWFVPTRLLWDSFEDFITGGPDGDDDSEAPYIDIVNPAVGSLADYLGVPTGTYTARVSALPFRAYALIFNEWYRDQDLVTKLVMSTGDGADTTTNTTMQVRAWEKDYFTTARPWEQKGTAVTLPLGSMAPVVPNAILGPRFTTLNGNPALKLTTGSTAVVSNFAVGGTDPDLLNWRPGLDGNGDAYTGLQADLSLATAVDVNDVRFAFAMQRMLEARARYGSRFTEYLAYLGVRADDARLQRPEFLAGGKNVINFSEVLQTAEGTNPVGTMKGHGVAAMRSNRFTKSFQEHGWIISIISCIPRTVYMDGLPRHWTRWTKDDYWQRELQHIGQQEVLKKEVYAMSSDPNGNFGYQDRYDEYRQGFSSVSGEFRTTLTSWHLARDFSAETALNSAFVQANGSNRVFASTSTDQFYCMARNKMVARRLVAREGTSFTM